MTKRKPSAKPSQSDYGTPELQAKTESIIESADIRLGVTRRRIKSQWQIMQDRGALTRDQHAAAIRFEDDFHAAGLMPHYASIDPNRAGGRGVNETPQRMIDASRRVTQALSTLGGSDTTGYAVIWYCVGCGYSVPDYVARARAVNGRMDKSKAIGALQVALDVLAAHYGITRQAQRRVA